MNTLPLSRAAGNSAPHVGQYRHGVTVPAARVVGRPLGSGVGSLRSRVLAFTSARITAGLSHLRVALALGISETAVYAWERGTARPSEDHVDALAELFRCERSVIERWFGLEFVAVHR